MKSFLKDTMLNGNYVLDTMLGAKEIKIKIEKKVSQLISQSNEKTDMIHKEIIITLKQ